MNKSAPKRILVVEEDVFWRASIRKNLESLKPPVKFEFVNRPEEALDLLKKDHLFDLIIADLTLRGSTGGIDLWKFSRNEQAKIPMVLISGNDEADLIGDWDEVPMFVPKKDLQLAFKNGLVERLTDPHQMEIDLDAVKLPSKMKSKNGFQFRPLTWREILLIVALVAVAAGAYYAPRSPMMTKVITKQ